MRHYIMHFWQQLPSNVSIYIETMKSLDFHMYSLLENVYLSDVNSAIDNLKRMNTIATLIPVWLSKAFECVFLERGIEPTWLLKEYNHPHLLTSISQIKVNEANKWSYRIKSKINLIVTIQVSI